MSCNLVQLISGNECIGDSREKINNNFLNLEDTVCTLSSTTIVPTDTSTIEFIYTPETRVLTAAVKPGSIDSSKIAPNAVTAEKLSGGQIGSAPIYGIRAWAVFDGSGTGAGTATIISQGNISSVSRVSTGIFDITFTTNLPTSGYGVIGTPGWSAGSAVQGVTLVEADGIPVLKTTSQCRVQVVSTSGSSALSYNTSVMFVG